MIDNLQQISISNEENIKNIEETIKELEKQIAINNLKLETMKAEEEKNKELLNSIETNDETLLSIINSLRNDTLDEEQLKNYFNIIDDKIKEFQHNIEEANLKAREYINM